MTNNAALLATVRTETGKGSARRSRRAGTVPAVMYGHGIDPVHLDLPGHETFLAVKDSSNAIVTVKYDGKEQLCLVKSIQVHPVRRDMLHVDLQVINRDEKVEVEVPVVLVGEPAPATQAQQEEFHLAISAPAIALPEHIEVSIEGLAEGTVLRVADLKLPANVTTDVDGDRDVVSITAVTETAAESEAEGAAEAEVAAATDE